MDYRDSDGQHRQGPGAGGPDSGEKTRRERDTYVGDMSGGQEHGGSKVHSPRRDADISTEIPRRGR